MKVVSLFDGMSCGRVALERAGIPVTQYFSSEIDKYAIQTAQKNYPSTIQLGDVRVVRKMAEAGVFGHVDLLIGGSPCQGFSFAGKQLAFDDPRSALFFEYVHTLRALQKINPDIKFMLENVRMKKEFLDVITKLLGVEPHFMNSALVSAQNRQRHYWYNWEQTDPEDKGIFLKDIFEGGIDITDRVLAKKLNTASYKNCWKNMRELHQKSICLTASGQNISNAAATNIMIKLGNIHPSGKGMNGNVYSTEGKSPTLTTNKGEGSKVFDGKKFYKLTPVECERLMTLPDNYTAGVSNTQRYKMLGNGWETATVTHIFKGLLG